MIILGLLGERRMLEIRGFVQRFLLRYLLITKHQDLIEKVQPECHRLA